LKTKTILEDVRTSYRLLYEYQRRMLDLVDYSAKFFGRKINKSISKFSSAPSKTNKNLSRWAWDWLTMYCTEYSCYSITNKHKVESHLSFILISDTGFFEEELRNKKITKDKTAIDILNRLELSKFKSISYPNQKLYL